jgi:membrane associated rhomboid family serine protease
MQHFEQTPKALKFLMLAIAAVSVLSPILSFFLDHFFHAFGPNTFLPLSLHGIQMGYFWQLITPFFLQSDGNQLSVPLLFTITLGLFVLWFTGKELIQLYGTKKFLLLYFSAGIFACVIALGWLFLTGSFAHVNGIAPPLMALMIVWLMIYPDMKFHYFHFIKIPAKWVVTTLLALPLLISLFRGEISHFIYNASGIIWGYLFGLFILKLNPLFHFSSKKIINIADFESDEDFMERILSKIARNGINSLSVKERKRLDEISRRKRFS